MDHAELQNIFKLMYGPHFTFDEFACKCGVCQHQVKNGTAFSYWFMKPEFEAFMGKLIPLRVDLGFPFFINSGYRCGPYNDSLYRGDGTHLDGPHTKGAADIAVSFERAYKLIAAAMARDMGVGPVQHGPNGQRFVHVDNLGPRFWTYPKA